MESYTLVTGASSGIGREVAAYLSKKHALILNGRNMDGLKETALRCKNEKDVILWQYDLAEYKKMEGEFSAWIKEQGVVIDSFVHCAGAMCMCPVRGIHAEMIESVYAVNVFAPQLLMKVLASKKYNSKSLKSAVFISSNISNRGAAAFSIYGASKSALDGLMRNLSVELAPDTRVNTILPGGMVTNMTKDVFEDADMKEKFEKNSPLGIGTPSDIAPAVEFLLSAESRWITGQQITIDGGRTIDITERRN